MLDGNVFLLNDDNIGKRLELEKIKKNIFEFCLLCYIMCIVLK